MKSLKLASAAASLGGLALFAATSATSATAAPTVPTAVRTACSVDIGSYSSAGDLVSTLAIANTPPTGRRDTVDHLLDPGAARISTRWLWREGSPAAISDSYAVIGASLYQVHWIRYEGTTGGTTTLTRIGSGWDKFTYLEESAHAARYGLRNDGVLFRWTNGWKTVGSVAGFGSVKTMALISETSTYDTFLANTRGGALYTVKIPVAAPMKAVVTKIRTSTWQGFETLIADKCGRTGTMLAGIDKETGAVQLYAVSHANGPATVIKYLGKGPTVVKDLVLFRYGAVEYGLLNGA